MVGQALPADRDPPMLLPGRTHAQLLCRWLVTLNVWPVTILPTPTPDEALVLFRTILIGNRLVSPLVLTLR